MVNKFIDNPYQKLDCCTWYFTRFRFFLVGKLVGKSDQSLQGFNNFIQAATTVSRVHHHPVQDLARIGEVKAVVWWKGIHFWSILRLNAAF